MGYKVSWIARSGRSTKELISTSQRRPTGERVRVLGEGYYLLEEPAGAHWAVLIAVGGEYLEDLDAERARSISENGNETLRFWCSDTVMSTELECFKNGVKAWSIAYDCEVAGNQPVIRGEVPPVTHEILKSFQAKQLVDPEVDFIYELTGELGSRLIGFRHDLALQTDSREAFQVLAFESDSRQARPALPDGPLSELLKALVLSGTLYGLPVKKNEDQLTIGSPELQVFAIEDGKGRLRLTLFRDGKQSVYRGSVARCAERIHSFWSPQARHREKP